MSRHISITKHMKASFYSGALKNMMGLCPFTTNSYFHWGTLKLGWFADVNHLSQCIADLNLVRKPDLCISDATTFITENGPYGPANSPASKRSCSTDRVSLDAFCCRFLGLHPRGSDDSQGFRAWPGRNDLGPDQHKSLSV